MTHSEHYKDCVKCDRTLAIGKMFLDCYGNTTNWCKQCVSDWYNTHVYHIQRRSDADEAE